MPTPRARFDFTQYKGILPHASELFGVYQPLLGWKSKRHARRFRKGFAVDYLDVFKRLAVGATSSVMLAPRRDHGRLPALDVQEFAPGGTEPEVMGSRSPLVRGLRRQLVERGAGAGGRPVSDDELASVLERDSVERVLRGDVMDAVNRRLQASTGDAAQLRTAVRGRDVFTAADAQTVMNDEAKLAATLMRLRDARQLDAIRNLLAPPDWQQSRHALLQAAAGLPLAQFMPTDPLDRLDPNLDLNRVALSPIGVVHLFRQYFFELDTFLGPPVGHVWLSPGTSLELIEVSTRKVVVEKSFEQSIESTKRSELASTTQDELADAIKQDNQQEIKFGASVTATYAGITATTDFDLTNTQKTARELSHKHMREQSTKLSTEIKTNYKTTFKTTTETTDTTSKRYVIQNPSPDKLQNYELRRKMRQVAVQVQDVGTYLCWQTYVDRPGDDLELSTLVHVAQPADLDSVPHPDKPAVQDPISKQQLIEFPYENISDGDDTDVVFYQGSDQESWPDHNDRVVWERDYPLESAGVGYALDPATLSITSQHSDVCVPRVTHLGGAKIRVSLDQVNFAEQASVKLMVTATWNPPAQDLTDYNNKMVEYTNARQRLEEEAYHKAVRERITLASKISPRPAHELREEERILIYRHLIQEMLLPKGYGPDDSVPETPDTLAARHVLSELINAIFDVDKMLYFVAPEWWKSRHSRGRQVFGGKPSGVGPGAVSSAHLVGWDRLDDVSREHYYITDESAAAKLGSSLGWVLQLDGDNLRNAFLNAPWVKAVMPIRPGKERAAINWLRHVEGFNGIGPTDLYTGAGTDADGNPLAGKTMFEVLNILADNVGAKHRESLTARAFDLSNPELPADPDSTVTATPVDRVWEHGFDPLQGGFQARPLTAGDDQHGSENFQTFDQWTEILPTDQVVPVPVEYDAKTGRLKDPTP